MPRVTKAMLESRVAGLEIANTQLRNENNQLKEINKLLSTRIFHVDEFLGMHRETIGAIAHVVTDLKEIIKFKFR